MIGDLLRNFSEADLGKYLVKSVKFASSGMGEVSIAVRSNSTRMLARRVGNVVKVSVPRGVTLGQVLHFLERVESELPKPDVMPHYNDGDIVDCGELKIELRRQSHKPFHVLTTPKLPTTYIEIGTGIDIGKVETTRFISKIMGKVAFQVAYQILLPRAREIAKELHCSPAGWEVTTGHRTLGHCSGRGIVALSSMLVFLPPHLRDYVVKHELAHLSEMNHSERFHQLCDLYCGGREKQLKAELDKYHWPVILNV